MTWRESGRTRLYTRRQRRRLGAILVLAITGAAVAAVLAAAAASTLAGDGPRWPDVQLRPLLTQHPTTGTTRLPPPGRVQLPATLTWPTSPTATALGAIPLWTVFLVMVVRPAARRIGREARHHGLASTASIRRQLGSWAVRRTGRFTLPDTTRRQRLLLPTSAFGYRLGHPARPWSRRALWADWEQRIRVIGRPGWGKTSRVLVPIIRQLPGAALVSSTEPAIFEQTVLARQHRAPAPRWRWLGVLTAYRPPTTYPIAVVDFSDPTHRMAAGYPQPCWSPIPGCQDFVIAHRRATALVTGVETDTSSTHGRDDRFFRDSAAEVLAAWLHAAALGDKTLTDLHHWLRKITDPTPARILDDHPRAEPTAALNLTKHLDLKAGRTTSGVERYLTLAVNSLLSTAGRTLCDRTDPITGHPVDQFDMAAFITAGGTLYVLADPHRIDRARPLLSLLTSEVFLTAEHLALRHPHHRLPQPFVGVLDELRHGITVSHLPYIAAAQRKYGIGLVYSVQSSTQETAVHGTDAPALRDSAGITLIGGIDIALARELADRAGTTPVVTPTRSHHHHTEHLTHLPTLPIADQQRLPDGHAVLLARGLAPFLTHLPSIHDQRNLARRITHETTTVRRHITAARAADAAIRHAHDTATAAGATP